MYSQFNVNGWWSSWGISNPREDEEIHAFVSCFIVRDFVALITNNAQAGRNASHLLFHPNPRIAPYIFILYCVILKPKLQL